MTVMTVYTAGANLARYEAARNALAEVSRVDEVKDIRDKWVAMTAYAKQAKDNELVSFATEIRLRAERRAGELLRDMPMAQGARGTGSNQYEVRSQSATAPPTLADLGVSKDQSSKWQKLAALPEERFEAKVDSAKSKASNASTSAPGTPDLRTNFTGNNEWYTPEEYIERARRVLVRIDLDPASSATAQQRVRADNFYTEDDNGLEQEWHGRVWLNPPYAQPLIQKFIEKLVEEKSSGRVSEAILLVNNSTDTAWFQIAFACADAECWTKGRIRFITPTGEQAGSPAMGQAFLYFGDRTEEFSREFGEIGSVRGPLQ